jgi:Uma2 family endonuclease
MGMAAPSKVWTRDEVLALQDAAPPGVRYELIDGELLVSPSPNDPHQQCVSTLLVLLYTYCKRHKLGRALISPADLSLEDDSIVQPDVFVVPPHTPRAKRGWQHVRSLLLAVEVLSTSTARGDRVVKRQFFQRHRVPEYWIVDYNARMVERWRPEDERPEQIEDTLTWNPVPTIEPLTIDLRELFEEALGDLDYGDDE